MIITLNMKLELQACMQKLFVQVLDVNLKCGLNLQIDQVIAMRILTLNLTDAFYNIIIKMLI